MDARPDPHFTFEYAPDQALELFMSFGLLNNLSQFFDDPAQLPLIYAEATVREAVLIEVLSTRDKRGKIENPFDTYEIQCASEHLMECLNWVERHLQDFFHQAFLSAKKAMKKQATQKSS